MSIKYKLLCFILVASALSVEAQVKISSPVSILGFGEITDEGHQYMQTFGDLKASFHSSTHINATNPASLAHLRTTIFSGGQNITRTKVSDGSSSSKIWSGNIQYLSIGLPLQNQINAIFNRKDPKIKWGMNIELRPYSVIGFDFTDFEQLILPGSIDSIQRTYEGKGSTYIASVSNGWQYKNWSVGLMVGHLFGSSKFKRTATFAIDEPGGAYSYQTLESDRTNYRGFAWNAGLMYDLVFDRIERADGSIGDPNKYLTLGITYHSNWTLGSETDQSIVRQNNRLLNVINTDTLSAIHDLEAQGKLPQVINFGVTYTYKNSLIAGVNYESGKWSNFDDGLGSETETVKDAFKLSGGVAYTPKANSITSYLERVTYSLGLHYAKDPRVLNGEQLENYGFNLGATLPFVGQRQVSYLTLNFGFGKLSVPNGYKENYFSFGLGYTLSDNQWFIKRKYD